MAKVVDLSVDLAAGRVSAKAAERAAHTLYTCGVECVYVMDPAELGPLATGIQVGDLLRQNAETFGEIREEVKLEKSNEASHH